jgi:hypothetical protein
MFLSCHSEFQKSNSRLPISETTEHFTFIKINKDSVFTCSYRVERNNSHKTVFSYHSEIDTFSFIYDSQRDSWVYISNKDTSQLLLEQDRIYSINNNDFKVYKVIRDSGSIDGELSYFLNIDFGLLIVKSNTWRSSFFANSTGKKDDDLLLSALLFHTLTDEYFYTNEKRSTDIDFIIPKLEK